MQDRTQRRLSFDEFDRRLRPEPEVTGFDRVVDAAISRRGFLGGTLAFGSMALIGTALTPVRSAAAASRFAFEQIAANTLDTVTLPKGYSWHIVAAWGDPLRSGDPEFDHTTRGTGASQAATFGDNIDGMELFVDGGRLVLCVNNEYTNDLVVWGNRPEGKFANADDVLKGKMAHGLTQVEVAAKDGKWGIVKDSPLNRRFTPDTPMDLVGPARGHDLMKTAADPEGTRSLGTWNNCGTGRTPWGTWLTCEENFNGYFSTPDKAHKVSPAMARYGLSPADWGYGWATIDERFDVAKHPNEANRCGWVVEIDPLDPASTPRKRTALGRFKHENAEAVVNADGRVVVYMGDDERGEFLYRFVTDGVFAPGGDNSTLLDSGTLAVAKFHDDGSGEWLDLTPATTGMASQGEVCIHARIAASKVGATTMDRPEWISANPNAAEVYCSLSNNINRGVKPNAGGDEQVVGGPNPRAKNDFGQVVRWRPDGADHTAKGFAWDLFVLAGNPVVYKDTNAGSPNVNAGNMFNSPDGLSFDPSGLIWIQTDGNYSNAKGFEGQGNNQMLCGDPVTGEIRRFLVGPNECEVTGLVWSPDRRTMFVGIQHPGEGGHSTWPGGPGTAPRSAVIAVTRDDGGLMG